VDYIWYTPNGMLQQGAAGHEVKLPMLRVLRTLDMPDSTRFVAGMPNERWPSDHVCLLADFELCRPA
jgi:mRNA deadenylase 3'-5' endonuclease subunit Ccr4